MYVAIERDLRARVEELERFELRKKVQREYYVRRAEKDELECAIECAVSGITRQLPEPLLISQSSARPESTRQLPCVFIPRVSCPPTFFPDSLPVYPRLIDIASQDTNSHFQGPILDHFRYGRPVPIISPPGAVRAR